MGDYTPNWRANWNPNYRPSFGPATGAKFDPLKLNPLLLLDGAQNVYGEFEQPALDWDASFGSSRYGPDPVVTRAGDTATYLDADGIIQTAPANTLRIDHGLGYPAFLIEPAATNLVPEAKGATPSAGAAVEGGFLDPTGGLNAVKCTGLLSGIGNRIASDTASVSGSTQYVASLYIKGVLGELVTINAKRVGAGAFSGAVTQQVILTGEWQRVDGLMWTTAVDNVSAGIFVDNNGTTDTANEVYVWGFQLELGAVSTSVIPTTGSPVTRNADVVTISGTDFSDMWNATEGTIYVEAVAKNPTSFTNKGYLYGDDTNQRLIYGTSGSVGCYDGATSNFPNNSHTVGELFRFALAIDALTTTTCLDGGVQKLLAHNGNLLAASRFDIGAGASGTNRFLGHIRRLIYWPKHVDNL